MRKSVVISAAAGILGLAGVLIHHRLGASRLPADDESASAPSARLAPLAEGANTTPPDASPGVVADEISTAAASKSAYRARLEASKDHWNFAADVFPAASAGDPAAQYFLSRALRHCDREFRFYFIRGNKRRTLDEAMQWASTRVGLEAEEAREIHEKCHRLQDGSNPFGTADEWLSSSKEMDFDLALLDSALQLAEKAWRSGDTENVEIRNEAKRLALQALTSKDPEVIFNMGDLATLFLGDTDKASKEQWVWRLAACKRGYECGQDAKWYQYQCRYDPNCQPYESGVDFIRRTNTEDFDDIERRANDLNSRLDANDFDWLGS
jgi:hypothetical protein